MDRKRLMTMAHGATAVTLLLLGVLNWQGLLSLGLLYLGIAITAGTHMLASPSRSALIPIIIPERELLVAASTDTASQNGAAIARPLLFAFIAVMTDLAVVFLTAGLLALCTSLSSVFIKARGVVRRDDGEQKTT